MSITDIWKDAPTVEDVERRLEENQRERRALLSLRRLLLAKNGHADEGESNDESD